MWAAPFWAIKRYVQVFPDNSSDSAERNLLYTPSFRDLVLLMLQTYAETVSQNRTDTATDRQLFDGELKLKCLVN